MRQLRGITPSIAAALVLALSPEVLAQEAVEPLDDSRWDLVYYRKTVPIPGRDLTVRFTAGRIWGWAGCNRFSGTYAVRGDSITVSDLAVGAAECAEPDGIMEQEAYYLQFLSDARTFVRENHRLVIRRWDRETLTYVPRECEKGNPCD